MYIVAIAWLYVALLMAATQPSLFTGLASFLFYGIFPMSIVLWISGTKVRRQRQRHRELLADQEARANNGSNPQADQQNLL
jgi:hypothetical protein